MLVRYAVGEHLNIRFVIASVTAALSLLLGLLIRANAHDWSGHPSEGPLHDVGAVLLWFAVVLMALLFAHWVADGRRGGRPPTA